MDNTFLVGVVGTTRFADPHSFNGYCNKKCKIVYDCHIIFNHINCYLVKAKKFNFENN
jgi:hypothetical protein